MKFLLPALTVLLTSTSALAAGHDWSGAYLGGQMGYASGTSRYSSDIDEQLKFSPDGFLGGIYGGYNHQFSNNMVLGLDADFSLANIKNNGKYYDGGIRDPEVGTSIKMRWNGAARIRAGYAVDRFLPYVAAGLSYGKYKLSVWDEEGSMLDVSKTRTGWTIGAGLDYAVTDNLIARVEYRYSDFGKAKIFSDVSDSLSFKTHDVRLGIAYSSEARRLHQTTGSSGAGRVLAGSARVLSRVFRLVQGLASGRPDHLPGLEQPTLGRIRLRQPRQQFLHRRRQRGGRQFIGRHPARRRAASAAERTSTHHGRICSR